ncbi:MAG TPA: hypothetical protein VK465_03630, partial [Fibrobacteria bacterium]|nr:hypothetical protein [Fibrobacteria bacterium]
MNRIRKGAFLATSPTPAEKKAAVLALTGNYPQGLVAEHARRLDADYFNEFTVEEIRAHLDRIAALDPRDPFAADLEPMGPRGCVLTVLGGDLPGFFAALSGMLASHDFDIKSGKVFTYRPPETGEPVRAGARDLIIDSLVLEHPEPD